MQSIKVDAAANPTQNTHLQEDINIMKSLPGFYKENQSAMEMFNGLPWTRGSKISWINITLFCSMLCMWSGVESWSYFYSDTTMNWEDARAWCREHYTDMVAIQNQEEIRHLNSWLPWKPSYYWIGIRKINNKWTWVGTHKVLTVEATNWAAGEPNNGKTKMVLGGSEDCVEMYVKREKQQGKWNDARCRKTKTALCYTAACRNDSCHHGDCVETINSHKCACFEGFRGETCDEAVKCDREEVTAPHKGNVSCAHKFGAFSFNSSCEYSCEDGYQLSSSRPVRCTASEQWSEPPPTCEPVQCLELSRPEHGSMYCSNPLGVSRFQSTCVFVCDEGFALSDSSSETLLCASSGIWSNSQPSCVAVQLPDPPALENGSVSCGPADYKSIYRNTCTFSCSPGHHLVGPSAATYSTAADWGQNVPRCEVTTCQYPEGDTGLITLCSNYSSHLLPGSTCGFSCGSGFQLQGAETIRCSDDGLWNEAAPSCKAIQCPAPESPINGWVSCSPPASPETPHPLGIACTFGCDDGHELQGGDSMECEHPGQWSSSPPTCTAMRCQLPQAPENGDMNCSNDEPVFNTHCAFTCSQGYSMEGHHLLICDRHGNWTATTPTCQAVQCLELSRPEHGSMYCSNPLGVSRFQSTCVFVCDEGFALSDSSSETLLCASSGIWSNSQPSCVAVQLPDPPALENGSVSCGPADYKSIYRNTCTFSCSPGHHLVGPSAATYSTAADWGQNVPRCEVTTCQYPEGDTGLITLCSNYSSHLLPGSTCGFSCGSGFQLQGAETIRCSDDGLWNEAAPSCKAIQCPAPESPINGWVSCSPPASPETPHPLGIACTFGCDDGHELQGGDSMECEHPGQWSSSPPTCTAMRCQLPQAPENGDMNCSNDEPVFNTHCAFTCSQGYSMEGHHLLICDRHGNWTATTPTCQAACRNDSCHHGDCVETINSHNCVCFEGFHGETCEEVVKCDREEVTAPHKGNVSCAHKFGNFSFNSSCEYSCKDGYRLSSVRPLRCIASKQWSGPPPTCEPVQCPELSHPEHGSMSCANPLGISRFQSTCVFVCDEGFVLSGSSSETLLCTSSGSWSNSKPSCVAVQLPDPPALENGSVSCGPADYKSIYRNTCTFSCSPGHHLVGPSAATYSTAADWGQNVPRCEVTTCQYPEGDTGLITLCSNSSSHLRPGSTCGFSCGSGFQLQGAETIRCSDDGLWNEAAPSCKAIQCPAPESPINGWVSCSPPGSPETPHPLGIACTFGCDDGHELQGGDSMECEHPGQWSSSPPTCSAVRCPLPQAPDNGDMNCSNDEPVFNTHCAFTCSQDYSMEGHHLLICDRHGNWTATTPTCQVPTASLSQMTAIASGVATGGSVLSAVGLAIWILKRLNQKKNQFELNSNSDIEAPPQLYKNSTDSLI